MFGILSFLLPIACVILVAMEGERGIEKSTVELLNLLR